MCIFIKTQWNKEKTSTSKLINASDFISYQFLIIFYYRQFCWLTPISTLKYCVFCVLEIFFSQTLFFVIILSNLLFKTCFLIIISSSLLSCFSWRDYYFLTLFISNSFSQGKQANCLVVNVHKNIFAKLIPAPNFFTTYQRQPLYIKYPAFHICISDWYGKNLI